MSGSDVVGDPARIQGTWFIGASSLPMWRRRRSPSLSYLPLPGGEMLDVVSWEGARGGRQRRLLGIDTPEGGGASHWTWRGSGVVTRFTTSRWSFVAVDERGEWALIRFARTPFTRAGADLLFRERVPGAEAMAAARAACAADPSTSRFLGELFSPPR